MATEREQFPSDEKLKELQEASKKLWAGSKDTERASVAIEIGNLKRLVKTYSEGDEQRKKLQETIDIYNSSIGRTDNPVAAKKAPPPLPASAKYKPPVNEAPDPKKHQTIKPLTSIECQNKIDQIQEDLGGLLKKKEELAGETRKFMKRLKMVVQDVIEHIKEGESKPTKPEDQRANLLIVLTGGHVYQGQTKDDKKSQFADAIKAETISNSKIDQQFTSAHPSTRKIQEVIDSIQKEIESFHKAVKSNSSKEEQELGKYLSSNPNFKNDQNQGMDVSDLLKGMKEGPLKDLGEKESGIAYSERSLNLQRSELRQQLDLQKKKEALGPAIFPAKKSVLK